MNERIRELAKQAGMWRQHYDIGEESPDRLERFAELIVQECLDAIAATKERPVDNDLLFYQGLFTAIYGIKKRFGFEE